MQFFGKCISLVEAFKLKYWHFVCILPDMPVALQSWILSCRIYVLPSFASLTFQNTVNSSYVKLFYKNDKKVRKRKMFMLLAIFFGSILQ